MLNEIIRQSVRPDGHVLRLTNVRHTASIDGIAALRAMGKHLEMRVA